MARSREFCAFDLLPLLARIVLCAAFLPVGYAKLMKEVEFTGPEAQFLRTQGVGTTLLAAELVPVSQEAQSEPGSVLRARSLYKIAILLASRDIPYPCPLAWAAAIAECLGAALLLVGFVSRFWAASLAAVMVVAFWMTSWSVFRASAGFDLPVEVHNRIFVQVTLFLLASIVVFLGPGRFSVDHLLLRKPGPARQAPRA